LLKLFGHQESGHAFKVKLALTIADIVHHYEWVDIEAPRESRSLEFRSHSRFSEVPLLLDEGEPYIQSNAILLHIAHRFNVLGGEDTVLMQRCREWLFWEANKIGLCLPQLRAYKKQNAPEIQEQTLEWLLSRYKHDVGVLNDVLSDGRDFIVGDLFTIADCSLCGYLTFADEAEVDLPPFVESWLNRISSLEGWKHPYELLSQK